MPQISQSWDPDYADLVNRNIGLISEAEQRHLKHSKIAIFGIGGFGGVIFEILVRSGIERFNIADRDVFEATNMNRQIFATGDTLGVHKTAAAKKRALSINPNAKITTFGTVDETNVESILLDTDLAVLVLDDFKSSLIVARKARALGITFVEGWALPFANVCTFTPESASFESTYGLDKIKDLPAESISEEQGRQLLLELLFTFGNIEEVADYYSEETLTNLARGIQPSFAPMVWFTATLIALEGMKVLLNKGELAFSPNFAIYDPFKHKIPKKMKDLPDDKKPIVHQLLTQPQKL